MDDGGIVGRGRELGALERALETCVRGRGVAVAVTGEAGIGKTRLLEVFAERAAALGRPVAWGHAWEAGGAPALYPWREALASLGIEWPEADADDAYGSFRLFEAVGSALAGTARANGAMVVILEDLHVADGGTFDLLRFLAPRLVHMPLLVVCSWREVEARLAGAQLESFTTMRVRLGALERGEVAQVLEEAHGAAVGDDLTDAVYELAGGNPLHALEAMSLRMAGETGVPEVVRINTERRLRGLSPEARKLLLLAAIAGREFDAATLVEASGSPLEDVLTALDEARSVELVTITPNAGFRFRHALVRDALEESLEQAERSRLHHAVGEALERRGAPAASIARHYVAAVTRVGAAAVANRAMRAGDEAASALAFDDAASHYTVALDLVGSSDLERSIELLVKRGRALLRTAARDDAKADFRVAIERARRIDRPDLLAQATLGFTTTVGAGPVYGEAMLPDAERKHLLRAALDAQPPGDDALKAELMARLAMELWSDVEAASECGPLLDEAKAMAARIDSPRLEATMLLAEFLTAPYRDGPARLVALVDRLEQLAAEVDDLAIAAGASLASFIVRLARGDIGGARQVVRAHAAMAERFSIPAEQWRAAALEAGLSVATGSHPEAEAAAQRAYDVGRALGHYNNAEVVYLVQQAMLLRRTGSPSDVDALTDMCVAAFQATPSLASYGAGAGYGAFWLGDDAAAVTRVRSALSVARRLPRELNWSGLMTMAGEIFGHLGTPEEQAEAYEALAPWSGWVALVGSAQDVWGPIDRALSGIAAARGEWEEAERLHRSALALDRAMGTWLSELYTRSAWARLLVERGWPGDHETAAAILDEVIAEAARRGSPEWGWWLEDLRRAAAGSAAVSEPALPAARSACLSRTGGGWTITYAGREVTITQGRGFDALAMLLDAPGREVHVLDLSGAGVAQADLGPDLDDVARRSYLARAEELRDELAEAENDGDLSRIDKIRDELEFIAASLSGAVGRAGRPRPTGSTAERARVATTKALKAAIARIGEHHPELGGHLTAAVRTGTYCRYEPDPTAPIDWTVRNTAC